MSNAREARSERIAIRLRPSVKELAEEKARAEDRTLSSWVERVIREALDRERGVAA